MRFKAETVTDFTMVVVAGAVNIEAVTGKAVGGLKVSRQNSPRFPITDTIFQYSLLQYKLN